MSNRITIKGAPLSAGDYEELNIDHVLSGAPQTAQEMAQRLEDLSVDTPSLVNRDTEIKNLLKLVKSRGGFDGCIWQAPRAGRVKGTGECYIFDGDHSRHLFKAMYPTALTMPMEVIHVDSKEEIHKLFVQVNKSGKNAITSEQVFVHMVLAKDKTALKYDAVCKKAGLAIYCSHEASGTAGDASGVKIKMGHLSAALAAASDMRGEPDTEILSEARELLMQTNTFKPDGYMPGWIYQSLCVIFSEYSELRPTGENGEEFKNWFLRKTFDDSAEEWGLNVKKDCTGGFPVTNRMAAGIISEIRRYQKTHPDSFAGKNKLVSLTPLRKTRKQKRK